MQKFQDCSLWGKQRFSIGMWIGGDITPNEFPYTTGDKGKHFLNCEGELLPQEHAVRRFSEEKGDPAQIQKCPICKNILCLPKDQKKHDEFKQITWIIKSPKSLEELKNIPKSAFERQNAIILRDAPLFQHVTNSSENHYYRLSMNIAPARPGQVLDRKLVDSWWQDFVKEHLDPDPDHNPLESTRPSMPGYFFLHVPGSRRPHDFIIFCTNQNCKLNKTTWFEKFENSYYPLIPKPFQIKNSPGMSTSVPISAFTYDEQVYYKCPSFVISTVDKFANLPFEPRCASLFGNVDVVHPISGSYGRRAAYVGFAQQRNNNKREEILSTDLRNVHSFYPPSLILQDELHLIEDNWEAW